MKSLGLSFGKSEKALAALAVGTLALTVLEPTFASLQPFRQFALALLLILGGLVAMMRLGRLGGWLARKFLWRVRHRMVAVFFFVGALPISIGALMATWGIFVLLGPITAYMLTSQLQGQMDRIQAMAEPMAWQLRHQSQAERLASLADFHAAADQRFPGLAIQAEFDSIRVSFPEGSLVGEMPSKLRTERTLVRIGGGVYLASVADDEQTGGRVVLAVPLTESLMRRVMPELGILSVTLDSSGEGSGPWPVVVSNVFDQEGQTARAALPPPRYPLDWMVRWPIQAQTLEWNTNEVETATYFLLTRVSALWGTIIKDQPGGTLQLFVGAFSLLLAAFAASVLVSLVIAGSLTRTLTRAVNDLYVGTKHVNEGDFKYRIPVSGSDQVSDLSRSFNAMTQSIEELIEESKRRQQLEAELEVAREVQSRLFPAEPPALDSLELLGICRPARSVSGDFFDYVDLDSRRVAISFGDVSGKGISAALVMASLHSIVRGQLALLQGDSPEPLGHAAARLVEQANRQLCENTAPEKFSTLFFGVYDVQTGMLAYSNAGHLPPLLLRNGSVEPLKVNGMIVGAFPYAEYTATNLSLEPGDTLVAYTDGLTEPENAAGEEFGDARLREALKRGAPEPPRELIEEVMDEVITWTGTSVLQDDMTMLVVRRR